MHSIFLQEVEGVSLERVDPLIASDQISNWKSASSQAGFATPGAKNSNSSSDRQIDQGINIVPEAFIPRIGQPDFARIEYAFPNGGYIGSVHIFDVFSNLVKTVAENELLGTSGFFRWDGDQDDGSQAEIGPYLVRFDVFDATGNAKRIFKRVVVAGQF